MVSRGVVLLRGRGRSCAPFPAPARQVRACGAPAHGLPTPFTAGIRRHPPGPEGPGCGNGSVKADQAELVIGREGDDPASERSGAAMFLGEESRYPHQRVTPDLLEAQGRVPVTEEP